MNAIDTLWTGGWDSTFRVLFAVIVEKRCVNPHYVIDVARKSSLRELQAISEIRRYLERVNPDAAALISNLKITPIEEIRPNEEISSAYKRLTQRAALGGQYDWLARYAKEASIRNLELSVHVDDKAYFFLKDNVRQDSEHGWVFEARAAGDESIFSYFSFPLLELAKTQMRRIAQEHGFLEILELSWFCHSPRNGQPCGVCNPCIYTVKEGMGYRLPLSSMMSYRTRFLRKISRIPAKAFRKLVGSR